MSDAGPDKPRLIGVNHVALEVGDVEEALRFYGAIFAFSLRGRHDTMAFLDMGDQFLALAETKGARERGPDYRPDAHFGLVVDDRSRVMELALAAGGRKVEGPFLDFLDPWGNRIEVVDYARVQFSKTPGVLAAMEVSSDKSEEVLHELAGKGITV